MIKNEFCVGQVFKDRYDSLFYVQKISIDEKGTVTYTFSYKTGDRYFCLTEDELYFNLDRRIYKDVTDEAEQNEKDLFRKQCEDFASKLKLGDEFIIRFKDRNNRYYKVVDIKEGSEKLTLFNMLGEPFVCNNYCILAQPADRKGLISILKESDSFELIRG